MLAWRCLFRQRTSTWALYLKHPSNAGCVFGVFVEIRFFRFVSSCWCVRNGFFRFLLFQICLLIVICSDLLCSDSFLRICFEHCSDSFVQICFAFCFLLFVWVCSVCLFVCWFVCLSVCLIVLFLCLLFLLVVCLFVCLFVCLSIGLFVSLFVVSVSFATKLFLCFFVCLFVRFCVCLSIVFVFVSCATTHNNAKQQASKQLCKPTGKQDANKSTYGCNA